MNYSPIESLRIKNFRNIGDITLDFRESPIITLIGDNEAGKTSVVKAFSVLGLNAFPKKQNKYIRQGTNGFGIELVLEDGTVVTRMKTNTTNALSIRKGNDEWSVGKIDPGMVPVKLQEVMGLIEEPETKELIHIRTYEDQLLFVVTADSTNYKVMYNALKVDQLTRAIKLGTTEVNGLKQTINTNEVICNDLLDSIRKIQIVDTEAVSNVKDRLKVQLDRLRKLERAMDIKHDIDRLNDRLKAVHEIEAKGIDIIDMTFVDKLNRTIEQYKNADRLRASLSAYIDLDKAEQVDTLLATKLENARQMSRDIEIVSNNLGAYKDLQNAEQIEISLVDKFVRALSTASTVKLLERKNSILDLSDVHEIKDSSLAKINSLQTALQYKNNIISLVGTINQIEQHRIELNNLMKESGAIVSTCPRCGEDVVVDVTQLEESGEYHGSHC